ncbi:MAG TPA: aspartyl protease family protein [Gemmatimonadales bacterium]|nr:aspartyl protease family protein [Gemmatimonadales bacterium]
MNWLSPRSLLPVLATALVVAPLTASAQIYRWVSDEGDVHYSQGVDSVPVRLRPSAVIIGYDRPSPPEPEAAAVPGLPAGTGRVKFTPGQPIMVTARINDTGSVQLMLDTGAARTVINPAALSTLGVSYASARRASLKGVTGDANVEAVRVESLDVSGAMYGPLIVISHDTGFGLEKMDGLLGRDFLDNFTITIDNVAGVLTLTPK